MRSGVVPFPAARRVLRARRRARAKASAGRGAAALLAAALASAVPGVPARAQLSGDGARPKVFFDCQTRGCDLNYLRTEIAWVDWVRQPQDADVYVIMTSQVTGAGGREYQLDYSGAEPLEYEEQMRFQSLPTSTRREVLDGLAHVLAVGLLHFAASHRFAQPAAVVGRDPGAETGPVVSREEVDDPWDFWVFRIGGNAELDGEQTRRTTSVSSNFNASRVTPVWKMNFRGNVDFNRREIDLAEGGEFVDERTDWGVTELVAYAFSDHWSAGVQGEVRRIRRFNQRLRFELTPALEYSYFPYEEATRRSLTAFYRIGPAHRRYVETTVFGQDKETRWEQALEVEFSQRQQWGDASVRLQGSHFLHDASLYNLRLRGNVRFRVARGLDFYANGGVSWVADQVYLSARGVTDEEALLNLQQRSQDFNYSMEAGLGFQFGSIYNNVVNNRFRGTFF